MLTFNYKMMISQTHIITTAIMFGSVYILSASLIGLNKRWMSDFSLFEIITLSIIFISGTMLMMGYKSIEIC